MKVALWTKDKKNLRRRKSLSGEAVSSDASFCSVTHNRPNGLHLLWRLCQIVKCDEHYHASLQSTFFSLDEICTLPRHQVLSRKNLGICTIIFTTSNRYCYLYLLTQKYVSLFGLALNKVKEPWSKVRDNFCKN